LSKEAVVNALAEMGLREDIRGEKLTLEEFAELSDRLKG
jgi:16S rRNA (adenine1518-N6/adenine1519-N6)-dimethyltransferase